MTVRIADLTSAECAVVDAGEQLHLVVAGATPFGPDYLVARHGADVVSVARRDWLEAVFGSNRSLGDELTGNVGQLAFAVCFEAEAVDDVATRLMESDARVLVVLAASGRITGLIPYRPLMSGE